AEQVVGVELVGLPVATAAAARLGLRFFERLRHLPAVSVAVVFRALLGVAQHLVGAVNLLEALLGTLIARVYVRMMLARQLAVGLFDFFLRGAALEPQHLIVVSCHRYLVAKFYVATCEKSNVTYIKLDSITIIALDKSTVAHLK